MAAAHVQAVRAITADPGISSEIFSSPADAADLANGLCTAAGCGPGTLALQPELQHTLGQALRCAPQEQRAGAAAVWELLRAAKASARLATALLVSGGLGVIVNWLSRIQAAFSADFLLMNAGVLVLNVLECVRWGGRSVASAWLPKWLQMPWALPP
ncbi:methyltransferase [Chlorella sorokiniana]|uniref:Methyltransferase n=1 Tax=Chlorella sorokiniana TaxID=3076 RepID=A0A2P6TK07_CHLSO|nr:methyltransferase [Chlorella sorokiniana]|eukprot:PRW44410.1 methyltransferase [Chlorella sorokiniana]